MESTSEHITKHESNATRTKIAAMLNTKYLIPAAEESNGSQASLHHLNLNPNPSPTQVPTCGSLSDNSHSGEEETWTTLQADTLTMDDFPDKTHRLANISHPT